MPVIMSRFPLFTFNPSAYQIAMRDWQQHQEERVFGGNDVSYKLKENEDSLSFRTHPTPSENGPMKGATLTSLSFSFNSYRFACHSSRLKSKGPPEYKTERRGVFGLLHVYRDVALKEVSEARTASFLTSKR